MDKEKMASVINEIRSNLKDPAKVTELLTTVFDETSALYNKVDSLTVEKDELDKANEKLRSANMDLFLKIGDTKKEAIPDDDPLELKEEPKRSFDDLFKEGGIK